MIRQTILHKIDEAVRLLVAEDAISPLPEAAFIEVTDPRSPEHGDYATNFALMQAKSLGLNPRELAEKLGEKLRKDFFFSSVEVAGPGFLNFRVASYEAALFVGEVLEKGEAFARLAATHPMRLNVEFVSVNPNGPITVGSGRGAAFGSTLCNVLEAAGHKVHREYYINDGVNSEQMRLFAETAAYYWLAASGHPVQFPEAGYRGDYVESDVKRAERAYELWEKALYHEKAHLNEVLNEHQDEVNDWQEKLASKKNGYSPEYVQTCIEQVSQQIQKCARDLKNAEQQIALLDEAKKSNESLREIFARSNNWPSVRSYQFALQAIRLESQKIDLEDFNVWFDTWFSEQSLHDSGEVNSCIQELIQKGFADEEPYRTKVVHKKGEPPQVIREDQPQDEEDAEGTGKTLWLRSTKFGDDQDRVLRRKDGRYTYIASDIAYHKSKFERGSAPHANGKTEPADKLVTILGPDHHGYIGRLRAVIQALGHEPDDLEVIIFQLVRFVKDGKPAPMRKRDGNIYALRDLYEEIGRTALPSAPKEEQTRVGVDVTRFFYLMRSHDTTMDFDIDLATRLSEENPVFYVQYAHARICSILRKAKEEGFSLKNPHPNPLPFAGPQKGEGTQGTLSLSRLELREGGKTTPSPLQGERVGVRGENADPTDVILTVNVELNLLTHPRELNLVKKICDLPYEIQRCAEDYGVHRLTTYAQELARAYHYFYDGCRVIQPEEPDLTKARLALCEATRTALKATFDLLGISSPERMERHDSPSD